MEEQEIKYTIIIPHKNAPALLQRCLDTIPNRDDTQVIVIDDNSAPDKVDFLSFPQWKGNFYETYFTKDGKGAGFARNFGLEKAKGKYILFADADDMYNTDNLNALLDISDDSYDVIIYPTQIIHENGRSELYPLKWTELYGGFDITLAGEKRIHDCNIKDVLYRQTEAWNKITRASHIRRNNIHFEEVPVYNDIVATFTLAKNTKEDRIGVFTDIVYKYIRRAGSISDTIKNPKTEMRLLELFKVQKLLVSVGKQQYLGNIRPNFDTLIRDSLFKAIYYCIIQMNIVSFQSGVKSLSYVLTPKNIRIGLAIRTRIRKVLSRIH